MGFAPLVLGIVALAAIALAWWLMAAMFPLGLPPPVAKPARGVAPRASLVTYARARLSQVPFEIGLALMLVILLLGLTAVREPWVALLESGERWRDWVPLSGPLAPLTYMGLTVAQIVLAPLPGQFIAVLGGGLFGTPLAPLYRLIGTALGVALTAGLARYLGRPWLARLIGAQSLERWERKLNARSGFTWLLLFVFPVPDALYYVAGITGVPLRKLIAAATLGRAPSLIAATWFGSHTLGATEPVPAVAWTLLLVLCVVLYAQQRRIQLWIWLVVRRARRWLRKLQHRRP